MNKLVKYTNDTVIAEAELFLSGMKLHAISQHLCIPLSTVSWHLIHPLEYIDYDLYIQVRSQLNRYAKNQKRQLRDETLIYSHNEGIITGTGIGRRKHNEGKNKTRTHTRNNDSGRD